MWYRIGSGRLSVTPPCARPVRPLLVGAGVRDAPSQLGMDARPIAERVLVTRLGARLHDAGTELRGAHGPGVGIARRCQRAARISPTRPQRLRNRQVLRE